MVAFRPVIFVVALALISDAPATAGPFEDASAAFSKGDLTTALRLLQPLANQGHAGAQWSLGVMYGLGKGVPQDRGEAAKWYRRAADQGFVLAQSDLGLLYFGGLGVPQNDAEAVKWYRRAADQGYAVAQFYLGAMYFGGRGVPQDYAEGEKWLRRAADQGNADAQTAIRNLRAPAPAAQEASYYGRCTKAEFDRVVYNVGSTQMAEYGRQIDTSDPNFAMNYVASVLSGPAHSPMARALREILQMKCGL